MLQMVITYRGDAVVQKKQLRRIAAEALAWALRHWHRRMLPKHFQPGAAGRYHYQRRRSRKRIRGDEGRIASLSGWRWGFDPVTGKRKRMPIYKTWGGGGGRVSTVAPDAHLPLIWTGWLKRAALREVMIRTTKGRPTAKGIMKVPGYVTASGKKYWVNRPNRRSHAQPDMPRELTATTAQERKLLAKLVERFMARRLNNLKQTRTVRIK